MASRIPLRCFLYTCVYSLIPALQSADLASKADYEGKRLAQVRFDPAVQPVAKADLDRLLPFQPGTPIRLDDIRGAIKRLYGTGQYSTIEVDTEPAPSGLTLVFRTRDQWFVGPVEVHGKVKMPPNEGQLANASRLELGQPFQDTDIQAAVESMRGLLERNGLYRATVTPKIERDVEHQEVAVTFEVKSGKRARLMLPVITGDTKIPADQVAKAAKYKGWLFFPWKLATQQNVQAGLQNIRHKYEKQDRLTASVTLDHSDYLEKENRVRPTINADGGPKIKIQAKEAKVSKGTLQKYVPVFDEETVNRDLLVAGARNLRDYFQNKGYFDVQVEPTSKDVNPDLREITYVISLGERHKVVEVNIKGNKYFTTDQIKERMFIQPAGFLRLRHGRYSEGFETRDEDAIKALYRDNGFRDATVDTKLVDDFQGKKGDVSITLTIAEGPQYLVSSVTVDGITQPNREQMISRLASVSGEPFSETNVAMDRDHLLQIYQSTGYPDAGFDWRLTPGPGPQQVTLEYKITEGKPQLVRDLVITGMHTTRHRLVDPNITLHAGDPLSWTAMGRMQRNLYNLGVFDRVDMAIQNPNGDVENKYVDFHLSEGHLYNMAFGLGGEVARFGGSQTSLDNPGGATGFAPRVAFEISRMNLWGLGHSLNLKTRYSTLDRRGSLNYLAPRFHNVDGRNISVTALYDNTRDVLTFTAVRLQGSAQLSQKLSKATNILMRYSWTSNRVDASTLKISPFLIPLYAQTSHVGQIGANLIQDRRDDPADAHRGIYNSIDLGVAEHYFGGNRNFLRLLLRNSYYKRLGADFVLASNTQFGVIRPFATGSIPREVYVPLPERFFGGGEASMRGFPTNQAGPRDPLTGYPLGGDALFFHSTELRFPFIGDNIQGVFFHDFGNVFSGLGNISFRVHQKDLTDFDYTVHAAGFGVRYRTPVGPVRVDLAYSINPPTFNGLSGTYHQLLFGGATPTIQSVSHFQFFISIGQAF